MSTEARLTLAQWLSPAFPLGSFAYSHGLEAAMAAGDVLTADDVCAWVGDVVTMGSGRIDAVILSEALRDGADLGALAAMAKAMAGSRERLAETEDMGAAFARTVGEIGGDAGAAEPLPVAVGRAARGLGLEPDEVIAQYLQAFAATLVMAAVRFLPLGQTEGQKVIADLRRVVLEVAKAATAQRLDEVTTASFGADRAAMAHETLDVRIFRT